MFWTIVLIGGAVSAGLAFTKGQNPLIWFFGSAPGAALLTVLPPAKGNKVLGERKRARRSVGDKVGMATGGIVVGVAALLGIIGVV
ncbi:MAG: hypothetical protein ACI9MR_003954 [Myxococcota bacterium]|jgi:hypothetical protein